MFLHRYTMMEDDFIVSNNKCHLEFQFKFVDNQRGLSENCYNLKKTSFLCLLFRIHAKSIEWFCLKVAKQSDKQLRYFKVHIF